jgi:hypothetical protein
LTQKAAISLNSLAHSHILQLLGVPNEVELRRDGKITDNVGSNTATIYKIATNGSLKLVKTVATGGAGDYGGFYATANVNVPRSTSLTCAFAADGNPNFETATIPDVAAINLTNLKVVGTFAAGSADNASDEGVSLTDAGSFLIAAFTGNTSFFQPPTLGTYKILTGCKLKYLGSIEALGLERGTPIGVKATPNGKILIVSYSDGSIGSFTISSSGKLKLIGQEATAGFPGGVDITSDGKWAIFGDAANPPAVIVAPIKSSGALGTTVVYSPFNISVNSNNVSLSPDETLLLVSNNSLGTIGVAPFNKATGVVDIAKSCTSDILKYFDQDFFFGAGMNFSGNTGTGGKIYLAEGGFSPAGIAIIDYSKKSNGGCQLTEDRLSPVADPGESDSLLSIGRYPSRPF